MQPHVSPSREPSARSHGTRESGARSRGTRESSGRDRRPEATTRSGSPGAPTARSGSPGAPTSGSGPEPTRLAGELFRAFEEDPSPVVNFLEWLAGRYRLPRPPRLLDLGCGTGRVLVPLARRGFKVTGMEPDPAFRAAAREAAEPLAVPVREGGFNDLEGREAFELIIACNSSFAHLLSADERADALRRCRRALAPGGVLLLDVPNYLWMLFHYRPPADEWSEWRGHRVRLRRHRRIDAHAAVLTTVEEYTVFGPDGEPILEHRMVHPYAMVTFPELAVELERAGLARLATFSSYEARSSETLAGERMMVAARRPGV